MDSRKAASYGVFYQGCTQDYRRLLDSSNRGSFLELNIRDGERLIDTMARNDQQNRERYGPATESKDIMIVEKTAGLTEQTLAESKEVCLCGKGSQWDDGSAQILREIEQDNLKKDSRRRTRITQAKNQIEALAAKEPLNSQKRIKSNPETHDHLRDLDELQGMIDATIEIEKDN